MKGLGLGLSIVKHLVELHGGTARADSDGIGRGATFFVELPLAMANGFLSAQAPTFSSVTLACRMWMASNYCVERG